MQVSCWKTLFPLLTFSIGFAAFLCILLVGCEAEDRGGDNSPPPPQSLSARDFFVWRGTRWLPIHDPTALSDPLGTYPEIPSIYAPQHTEAGDFWDTPGHYYAYILGF